MRLVKDQGLSAGARTTLEALLVIDAHGMSFSFYPHRHGIATIKEKRHREKKSVKTAAWVFNVLQ